MVVLSGGGGVVLGEGVRDEGGDMGGVEGLDSTSGGVTEFVCRAAALLSRADISVRRRSRCSSSNWSRWYRELRSLSERWGLFARFASSD